MIRNDMSQSGVTLALKNSSHPQRSSPMASSQHNSNQVTKIYLSIINLSFLLLKYVAFILTVIQLFFLIEFLINLIRAQENTLLHFVDQCIKQSTACVIVKKHVLLGFINKE